MNVIFRIKINVGEPTHPNKRKRRVSSARRRRKLYILLQKQTCTTPCKVLKDGREKVEEVGRKREREDLIAPKYAMDRRGRLKLAP